MELSADQTLAVRAGTCRESWWEPVATNTNPIVPDWALDIAVDWVEGFANRPKIKVLHNGTAHDCDFRYQQFGRLYLAEIPDGRGNAYYAGPLAERRLQHWDPTQKQMIDDDHLTLCTSQDEGYAGRHFKITLTDGREAVLRGPWHGCPPEGFNEVYTYDATKAGAWEKAHADHMRKRGLSPRWPLTGNFGLIIRDQLFIDLVSRFCPELRLARVHQYGMTSIEPRLAGQPPKNMTIDNLKGEWDYE